MGLDAHRPLRLRARLRASLRRLAGFRDTAQDLHDVLGLSVTQVMDLGVSHRHGGVQLCDQGAHRQTALGVTGEDDGIGARIGEDLDPGARGLPLGLGGLQLAQLGRQVVGVGVPQFDHLEAVGCGLVDARDQVADSAYVDGRVRHQQGIGLGRGCQVPTLGHQRAQDGHQLGCAHMLGLDHVSHDVVVAQSLIREQIGDLGLFRLHIGYDLGGRLACHRSESVDLQYTEKEVIQFIASDRPARDHAHAPTHPRVHDEVRTGLFGDQIDQRLDFGIAQIQRQGIGLDRQEGQPERGDQERKGQDSAQHGGSQSINWTLSGTA